MNDIQKIFPIVKVSDNKILSGIGDITFGYEMFLPEVFSLSEQDYINIYCGLLSAFSICPEGVTVNQQDYYWEHRMSNSDMPKYNNYALRKNREHFLGRKVLRHKSNLFFSYPDKYINALTSGKNSAVNNFNYLKNPFKEFPATFEKAERLSNEINVSLQGIEKVKFRELTDKDLLNNIYYHYSFENDFDNGKTLPKIENSDGCLKVGNKYVGIISMVNNGEIIQLCKKHQGLPYIDDGFSIETGIGLNLGIMFQTGFGLPFEHTVSRTFTIRNQEKTDIKFFFESSKENFLAAMGVDNAKKRMRDIEGFRDAVANKNYNYVDMSCTIIIPSESPSELYNKVMAAKTVLRNVNKTQIYEEPYSEALPIWVGCTPGYARGNYRTFITVSQHALAYFNYETVGKGFTSGHLFVSRLGEPILIETWKTSNIDNRNGLIEGGSGSGKSFLLNNIIDQDLNNNYHVIILDVGHTYRDLCRINKGVYYDSSKLEDLAFNIFDCEKNYDGNYMPDSSKILLLQSILVSIWKGNDEASNSEMAVIIEMINEYYKYSNENRKIPSMKDFYYFLKEQDFPEQKKFFPINEFLSTVEIFAIGHYSKFLNGTNEINLLNERLVVFDIKDVAEDKFLFPVLGLRIIDLVTDKVKRLDKHRKRFIIDEGWKILKSHMSDYIEEVSRTFRKSEAGLYLATQSITDLPQFVGEKLANALIANADTFFITKRGASENYEELKKWLSLTDIHIEMIKDLKKREEYREFFMKQGKEARILRLESSKEAIAVYSSTGEEKVQIKELYEKTGNIEYAIEQYTENNILKNYLNKLFLKEVINRENYEEELKLIEKL